MIFDTHAHYDDEAFDGGPAGTSGDVCRTPAWVRL